MRNRSSVIKLFWSLLLQWHNSGIQRKLELELVLKPVPLSVSWLIEVLLCSDSEWQRTTLRSWSVCRVREMLLSLMRLSAWNVLLVRFCFYCDCDKKCCVPCLKNRVGKNRKKGWFTLGNKMINHVKRAKIILFSKL